MEPKSNLVRRKYKRKSILPKIKKLLDDVLDYDLVSIEESDIALSELKLWASTKKHEFELIPEKSCFKDSRFLMDIYPKLDDSQNAYFCTDDYKESGVIKVKALDGLKQAIKIAKDESSGYTCFLFSVLDNYSFRINYYDSYHADDPNTIEIKRVVERVKDVDS